MNQGAEADAGTLTVEQALQQAVAHHQVGQLQDAERLYRAILQAQPNHPDANHNLGVLAVQVKQPIAALPFFKAALEANPNQGQFWLSFMDALIQAGQTDAARQALEQGRQRGLNGEAGEALATRLEELSGSEPSPQEISTLVSLFNEGKYTEAETLAQTMTVSFPLHGFGWKVLGASLQMQGKEALPATQKATELLPDDAVAHSDRCSYHAASSFSCKSSRNLADSNLDRCVRRRKICRSGNRRMARYRRKSLLLHRQRSTKMGNASAQHSSAKPPGDA